MSLSQLVYISVKKALPPGEIFSVQQQAMRNNARDEISGVLLFNRAYFLQCLEGEREQVTHTFTVIAGDPRHSRVSLLQVIDVDERMYPDWSMGLLDVESTPVRVVLEQALPSGLFMPDNLRTDTVQPMLRRLRNLHLTRR